ncbi:3-hydroxyphenylacetate 6-hydroxylase [Malassezia yamatoensis]|uniref:3-hydroxyphenylacetate 6-hydroxylase n=1 Tax=Malassezia yamatoensis TaxID=253288 RepID=A0AAJ5YVV5_9BASI|nr:3-hydroxyphenylacetate 6-hydroxylase [Malassezia yamatoensis]
MPAPMPSIPIVGSLFSLGAKPWETFRQVSKKSKIGLFKVRIGSQYIVVVNDMVSASQLFIRNGIQSASRPVTLSIQQTSSGSTPPPLGSSPWNDATRSKRTMVTSMLAKSNVQQYDQLIHNEVVRTMEEIQRLGAEGCFDPYDVLKRFSLNMSVGLTWGITLDPVKDQEWIEEILDVEGAIEHSRYPIDVKEMFPFASFWLRLLPSYRRTQKDLQAWSRRREVYLNMLASRLDSAQCEGTAMPSVLMHLIQGTERFELRELDQNSVLVSLLSAGLDAITWSVYWLLLFLAQHPELQDEMAEAIRDNEYNPMEPHQQNPPRLIDSVVKESLRYFSVNRLSLPRASHQPIRIGSSYIPKDTLLILNVWALNRDPSVWERAEDFDPYRFLHKDTGSQAHFAFGLGRRNCPGQHVAQNQLCALVSAIVSKYRISEQSPGVMLDPVENVVDAWALATMTRNGPVIDEEIGLETVQQQQPDRKQRGCPSDNARQVAMNHSRTSFETELDSSSAFLVWFDTLEENPRNWSKPFRLYQVFLASAYTVLSPISSTSNVPAIDVLRAEYGVDSALIANMMISAPMLGFLLAPSVYAPFSERFGRKYLLQVTNIA